MRRLFKITLLCCAIAALVTTYLYNKNQNILSGHRVVVCIPVYGQSLALGEEAERITDFDSLRINYKGRIVNENLNYHFGGYSDKLWKRLIKRLIHYNWRTYELSIYSMAKSLVSDLGEDTVICVFPGGMGETTINEVNDFFYPPFINDIRNAHDMARERGWDFYVPAICWMQGESDIIEYTNVDYKKELKNFSIRLNRDIKAITNQKEDVKIICYQSNVITRAEKFDETNYNCIEMRPAQAIVELIKEDSLFCASGPTYPYNFINESLHIDAIGQNSIGRLAALAGINIVRRKEKSFGVLPKSISIDKNDVLIHFSVPRPPLMIDTLSVKPIKNYGFDVITQDNKNIMSGISLEGDIIRLRCCKSPIGCKIRYAVNGEKMKSGYKHGPRGNLRDSQGEKEKIVIKGQTYPVHNWAYQFDILCNIQ